MRTRDDYMSMLESHEPGDTITVRTRRDGEELSYTITLAESQ